jgi:ABC-type polysaccharide/polyol phosphate export permease
LAGFWLIPIIWDYKILYENYHVLLYVPLTAFAVNFREVLIYDQVPDTHFMWIGILTSFVICVSGYIFMRYRSKKALEFL